VVEGRLATFPGRAIGPARRIVSARFTAPHVRAGMTRARIAAGGGRIPLQNAGTGQSHAPFPAMPPGRLRPFTARPPAAPRSSDAPVRTARRRAPSSAPRMESLG